MYREHLMDHYKNPREFGIIEHPSVHHHEKNPNCGDELTVYLDIQNNKIKEVKYSGTGCAISLAAMSMLAEEIHDQDIETVLKMPKEEMLEIIGTPLTTMRVKCGLLGLHTTKKAIYKYLGKQVQGEW